MGVDVDGYKDGVRLCSKERSSQRETTSLDTTHTRGRRRRRATARGARGRPKNDEFDDSRGHSGDVV